MEDLGAKETVIIVHGTWAVPKDNNPDQVDPDQSGNVSWYQIPPQGQSNFVSKLNEALERRGSPARCWAHCQNNSEIFTWSGNNAWIARTQASVHLAATINKLQANGWRCHVVAHSHGGNVVAEALPQLQALATSDSPTALSGTIITLGTPFIDVISPIAAQIVRRRKLRDLFAWIVLLLFIISGLLVLGAPALQGDYQFQDWMVLIIFIAVCFLAIIMFIRSRKMAGDKIDWNTFWITPAKRPFMLCLSSSMDEAWQLLYQMQQIKNPLAPKLGIISYLWRGRKDYIIRSRAIDRTLGVSFFSDQALVVKISVVTLWLLLIPLTLVIYGVVLWGQSPSPQQCLAEVTPSIQDRRHRTVTDTDKIIGLFTIDSRLFYEQKAKLSPEQKEKMNVCLERKIPKTLDFYLGFVGILGGVFAFIWLGLVTVIRSFFGGDLYSVMMAPVRWSGRQLWGIGRSFYGIGEYFVRQRSWSLLQEIALGLDGYRFKLPNTEGKPTFASHTIYKYEMLPERAKQRALARRDEWIRRNFGEVTETFSKLAVTASDLSSLLRKIETDLSLVHAAYYTDDECIERIADWIVGKATETGTGDAKLFEITEYGTAASHSASGH